MGIPIVVIVRLLSSFLILRFPLFGGVLAVILDYLDFAILRFLGAPLEEYQILDKTLDIEYMTLEVFVALFWTNQIARNTAVGLFFYRLAGVAIFALTQNPIMLVIFPNLFEFFFIFYLGFQKFLKKDPITSFSKLVIILLILLIPKLIHEYFLHVNQAEPWSENKYFKAVIYLK